MVMYSVIFLMNFNFNENFKIPKGKLLTLYILLMHVFEYYFYVNSNVLIEF
jgi:hypothetical protein